MKYAGIRHKNNQTVTYWFEVPDELTPHVHIDSEVIADTRHGKNPGTVVALLEGITEREAASVIGNHFPLRKIIGVFMDANIGSIHVPWDMATSAPEPDKIAAQIDSFYSNGSFSTPVIFTQDLNLHDGYTAYLVAKMFEHETLRGFCTVI